MKKKKPSSIAYLADSLNDNKLISPKQTLLNVLDDLRDGRKCEKLLVICVDDTAGLDLSFYASNLKYSEMLAILSRMQHSVNGWMD